MHPASGFWILSFYILPQEQKDSALGSLGPKLYEALLNLTLHIQTLQHNEQSLHSIL